MSLNKNNFITRSFSYGEAEVMYVDLATNGVESVMIALPKDEYRSERSLENACQKVLGEGKKFIRCINLEKKTELRAMPYNDFIKNSRVWDEMVAEAEATATEQ